MQMTEALFKKDPNATRSVGGLVPNIITSGFRDWPGTVLGALEEGHEALRGAMTMAVNPIQALSPIPIPMATEHPEGILNRIAGFGKSGLNLFTLGMSDLYISNLDQERERRGLQPGQPRRTLIESSKETFRADEDLQIVVDAAKRTINDALPAAEIAKFISSPMTGEEIGKTAVQALGKTAVLAGLGRMAGLTKPAPVTTPTPPRFVTAGDVAARKAEIAAREPRVTPTQASAPATEVLKSEKFPVLDSLMKEVEKRTERPIPPQATIPIGPVTLQRQELESLTKASLDTALFQELAPRINAGGEAGLQMIDAVSQAVRSDQIGGELVRSIAIEHALPVVEAAKHVGDALEYTFSEHGKGLAVLADLAHDLSIDALAGDSAAISRLKILDSISATKEANRVYHWPIVSRMWKDFNAGPMAKIAKGRRVYSIIQPTTTARNVRVAGAMTIGQVFNDATVGLIETGIGVAKGESRPISDYFIDSAAAFTSMLDRVENRGKIDDILKSLPIEHKRFKGNTLLNDAVLRTAAELTADTVKPRAQTLADHLTILNRSAEWQQGKFTFQARLEANMKRVGYSMEQVYEKLQNPTELIGETKKRTAKQLEFDAALHDAFNHSYKQGLRFNPEAGFAKQILNIYRDNPWVTSVGPLFPRFLINSYMYLTERSPLNWMDMLNPEFRKTLTDGLDGGLKHAESVRHLARGVEGMMYLGAAVAMRQSPLAGSKFYLYKTGQKDASGKDEFLDTRSYQPFHMYSLLAEYVTANIEGRPPNVSPSELTDAVLGARRVEEVPILSIADLVRNFTSQNPEAWSKVLYTQIGQQLASFFTGGKAIQDIAGAAGKATGNKALESQLIQRDTEGREFYGPTMANIPGLANWLPPRIDPFTGEPVTTTHPFRRQLGETIRAQSKLEQLITSIPGLQLGDLMGDFGNDRANFLVHTLIGKALGSKVGEGTLGDTVADFLNQQKLAPEEMSLYPLNKLKGQTVVIDPKLILQTKQSAMIRELYTGLKEAARSAGETKDPKAFVDHWINTDDSIPAWAKHIVREELRKQGLNY
jgi:hypothetical protein